MSTLQVRLPRVPFVHAAKLLVIAVDNGYTAVAVSTLKQMNKQGLSKQTNHQHHQLIFSCQPCALRAAQAAAVCPSPLRLLLLRPATSPPIELLLPWPWCPGGHQGSC
jgi:hypothetical protein